MIPNLKFSEMGGGGSGVNFGNPKSEVFQNGGGYSGVNFGHPKSEVFQNGGGVFRSKLWSGKFGPKFTVRPETCLCITVVSHILRMRRLTKHFEVPKRNEVLTSNPHVSSCSLTWATFFMLNIKYMLCLLMKI